MPTAQSRTPSGLAVSAEKQLRRRFWLAIALVTFCSLVLGLSLIAGHNRELRSAHESLKRLTDLRTVFDAANRISAERGPGNAVLGEPPAPDSPSLRRLRQFRAASDEALSRVTAIPEVGHAAREPARALAAARLDIDRLAALPLEARDEARIQAAIEAMFGVYDVTQGLVETAMTTLLSDHGSDLVGRAMVARMLSELREHAGRLGSHLIPGIARQQPLSPERRAAFEATRGRVLELWLLIRQQISASADPAVTSARKAVSERFFGGGMDLLERLLKAGGTGQYGTTPAAFTTEIVATFAPLEQLRDAFLNAELSKLEAAHARALQSLWLVATVTGALILFELLLLILSERLLFQPLLAARSRIITLADGKVDEPAAHRAAKGEMRALFDALEVLRQRLIERDALDIERAALTKTLKQQADIDGLTGILNRGALDRLAADLATVDGGPEQIGLILLDLDHFKMINDSFGHAAGDEVLKEVARRLKQGVRPGDSVARFGGEEFAVLLVENSSEAPHDIAERLRNALQSSAFKLGPGENLVVTASFGVAALPNRPGSWVDLVANADRALYAAKAAGRNRVIDNGLAA